MKLELPSKGVKLLFSLFVLLNFGIVTAQSQKTVTGTVLSSEDNMPLPGASVLIKGTNNGTSTDFDGKFILNVTSDSATLIISYIGYQTQEVTVSNEPLIIKLLTDANALDEVVVVGYGTQRKSNLVGSVASVDLDEATVVPTTNVAEMLRGRAAGVQINLADARPGGNSEILIRGKVSLVGNEPLIIVDGVPFDNINDVASDDISSIEVLKDAASTAIYGARAANGVILITTKRGKEGKINVNYHGYTTTQRLTKNFDLFSGEEFADLRREANRDRTTGEFLSDDNIFSEFELEAIANGNFVNWEDLILQDAVLQSHSLSVSSGTESTKIYSSLNYFKQDGLIPSSSFERGTLKLNIDQKISKKLSMQANVNFQTNTQDNESSSIGFISISPLAIPFDENGDLVQRPLGESHFQINPLWNIRESTNETRTTLTDINLTATYNFIPNLSYKLNAFLRNRNAEQGIYRTRLHSQGDEGIDGFATIATKLYKEYLIENIVNYNPQLNESHNLDFTFVNAISERKTNTTSIDKSGFANDNLSYNGAATVLSDPIRNVERRRLVSFLGRARYSFLDKYLFELTTRADASSVFAEDNKWGYFPAAAFAWKMHEESFLKDNESINEMKFRVTYGSTGNEGIDPRESLGVADNLPYVFGGVTSGGFAASTRLPNPNLQWETTTTFNVGLDFGLFNNLLSGTLEYYKANTKDFLLDRFVPGITGFSVTRFNIGEVQNEGFEATLNTNIIKKTDLQWSVGVIFSTNDNKVLKLTGELDEDGIPLELPYTGPNFQQLRLKVGEPINNIWLPQFDGIWQVGDDLTVISPNPLPGDVRVIDQNGDGIIDQKDNIYTSQDPDWFGTITTNFNYKGFELFVDFYIVEGATKRNPFFSNGEFFKGAINGIRIPYYTPENPSTVYPRPRADTASQLFPFSIRDASYSRLRTLTLGYNIPENVVSKIGLKSAKIYGTATNLFTITDYKSYSPENNPNEFPDSKGLTLGVKLGF
ncbi:SusC/RagA family TonB-linked outer membrane protein [Changchengzhania lutea]|uniref:SusC/RagA family TonB-linked outer membrane protein n=1 Tax=Changchengzhania lutea TaxID=2049305 RepID=UPI00115F67BE|nr:TonB-dependent receptor [Changchengzhania lutea]